MSLLRHLIVRNLVCPPTTTVPPQQTRLKVSFCFEVEVVMCFTQSAALLNVSSFPSILDDKEDCAPRGQAYIEVTVHQRSSTCHADAFNDLRTPCAVLACAAIRCSGLPVLEVHRKCNSSCCSVWPKVQCLCLAMNPQTNAHSRAINSNAAKLQ